MPKKKQNKHKHPHLEGQWFISTPEEEERERIDKAVIWSERRQSRNRIELVKGKFTESEKLLLLMGIHFGPEDPGEPAPEDVYEKYHGPQSAELDEIANEIIAEHLKPKSQFKKSRLLKLIEKAESLMDPSSQRARPGGKVTGPRQTKRQRPIWEKYQKEANKIWAKHPDWKGSDVLRQMRRTFPEITRSTFYRRIHKPS